MSDSTHNESIPEPPDPLDDLLATEQIDLTVEGEGYRVVLFNDDVHTVAEVVGQLMKALQCPPQDAVTITIRAHMRGHTVVTITTREHAEEIAGVLREISLGVSVDRV